MRILIVHRELPFPADNGGRLRAAHVARYLGAHHQVALVHFAKTSAEMHFPERGLFCDYRPVETPPATPFVRRLFSGVPSEVVDYNSAEMSRTIAELVAQHSPEVILTSEPALTRFLEPYRERVCVLDYLMVQTLSLERLAAISRGLKRMVWKLRWQRARAYHRRIAPFYDLCLVNSQEDHDDLANNSPGWKRLEFFPNGLDLEEYPLNLAQPEPNTLIYPGSVTYAPNRDAVDYMIQRILPRVQAQVPNVRLVVTGAVPDDGSAPQCSGVHYTGRVPDVRPVIAAAWACVVPLRSGAGGTRFKVLESMALGTPIVSTRIGAEGVDWTEGENISICDNPDEFADSTIRILRERDFREQLSRRGRKLIEQRYDWNVLGSQLATTLAELVVQKRP
jgi:glycosyltransferase involved in cell wall biosynthesis